MHGDPDAMDEFVLVVYKRCRISHGYTPPAAWAAASNNWRYILHQYHRLLPEQRAEYLVSINWTQRDMELLESYKGVA
jgi:hypothetical protein